MPDMGGSIRAVSDIRCVAPLAGARIGTLTAGCGLEDMLLEATSGWFANWWWLIVLVVALAMLRAVAPGTRSNRNRKKGHSRRTGRAQRRASSRKSSVAQPHPPHRAESFARTITGKAYVTDGDGIRVARQEVRLAGLDAPEWDQKARHRDGYWFNHGKRVKSALIQEIGGKHVHVSVESADKFGRLLGTVTYKGRDVGEWLVRGKRPVNGVLDERGGRRRGVEFRRGRWV